jgi:ABC-type Fe3+-siderophore transport system permease subunit
MAGGWLLRHSLDALSLGEESAQQLGVAVESDKRLVIRSARFWPARR